jgi:hypothetical protein
MEPPETLKWLLENDQPSVRYLTLTQLLDKPDTDPEVRSTRGLITGKGWVSKILAKQLKWGYFHNYVFLHWPKYVSTMYMVMVLADLGLTKEDPKMRRSCELLLRTMSKPTDGGFGFYQSSHFCWTGNGCRTFIKAGYSDDSRVRKALDWIVDVQKEDGGWHCFPSKRGTLDAWEGMSAFAALPKDKRTRRINRSIERGAEFFLEKQLYRQGKRYAPWFRFHYPVHYYYDALVGLDVLTDLGYSDDARLEPALKILRNKRVAHSRWVLDAIQPDIPSDDPYQSGPPWEPFMPMPFALEKVGEPSKMITLRSLRVLKRVGS